MWARAVAALPSDVREAYPASISPLETLDILVDKKTKALSVNWDDDIVKATALTRDGAVVHPNFQPKTENAA
jgi:NAD/NADP transhydrogenase alpha subunit